MEFLARQFLHLLQLLLNFCTDVFLSALLAVSCHEINHLTTLPIKFITPFNGDALVDAIARCLFLITVMWYGQYSSRFA